MKRLQEILNNENDLQSSNREINESLAGKGFAVSQNRQHQGYKAQVLSKLNAIQNDCHRAVQEEDDRRALDAVLEEDLLL